VDGEPTFVVSLDGVPIGPIWESSYFLGTTGSLDMPPIVALSIYLTILVVLVSAVVDVVVAWLDPRIRRAGLPT
jgi:ABC-type microcin C transport system permease subunit YejB